MSETSVLTAEIVKLRGQARRMEEALRLCRGMNAESLSQDAVLYVLERIRSERKIRQQMGFATEAFERLTKAAAVILGQPLPRVQSYYLGQVETLDAPTAVCPIDLRPFCAVKISSNVREEFLAPWTDGKHDYATDGRIIIRVEWSTAETRGHYGNCLFREAVWPEAGWSKLGPPDIYPEDFRPGVSGSHPKLVPLQGVLIPAYYVRMIAALPEAEICPPNKLSRLATGPVPFRFRGGEGLVMPMLDVVACTTNGRDS